MPPMSARGLPPYKPIGVSFLGVQKIDFGYGDVSLWRNNLVATSKRTNTLFIALCSEIRVYTPTYPTQHISSSAHFSTLPTPAPHANSRGQIDPQHPHSINSLTIGELGVEEVLVSAHDDGDVCIWYTRDLKKLALRLNVGQSAWGVALHKERRLVAVSANTHIITVFGLAVGVAGMVWKGSEGGGDIEEEDGKEEDEGEVVEGGYELLQQRTRRRKLGDNDEEKSPTTHEEEEEEEEEGEGEYSEPPEPSNLSHQTSRNGKRRREGKERKGKNLQVKDKAIRILRGHDNNIPNISFLDDSTGRWLVGTSIDGMVILWDVERERAVERYRFRHSQSRGWSVLFLKPQSFKPVRTMQEALGKPAPSRSQPQFRSQSWSLDIGLGSMSESEFEDSDDDDVSPSSGGGGDDGHALPWGWRIAGASRSRKDDEAIRPPTSFIFSTTEKNAHLLSTTPTLTPTITCRSPLLQPPLLSQHFSQYLGHIDRLNMVHYIPALSLIIAASQKGRVAIFRLTRCGDKYAMRLDDILPRDGNSAALEEGEVRPPTALLGIAVGPVQGLEIGRSREGSGSEGGSNNSSSNKNGDTGSTGAGTNIRRKNRRRGGGWRGLGVGRRYRLMMVYTDGVVLSYELGREPDEGDGGGEVLMV